MGTAPRWPGGTSFPKDSFIVTTSGTFSERTSVDVIFPAKKIEDFTHEVILGSAAGSGVSVADVLSFRYAARTPTTNSVWIATALKDLYYIGDDGTRVFFQSGQEVERHLLLERVFYKIIPA